MKKLALLAIPICLVFLLCLAIEDGFSRGGGDAAVVEAVASEVAGEAAGEGAALPIMVGLLPAVLP